MARFCDNCGHPLGDNVLFCDKCGRKATPMPQPRAVQAAYAPQPKKGKSRAGLFIGLGAGAVVLVVLAVVFGGGLMWVISHGGQPAGTANPNATAALSSVALKPFPDDLKVSPDVNVHCNYTSPDTIIPANYRSLDSIVSMQCWTDTGKTKLMVDVEIPGFTQKYEQMVDVSRAETELTIHPPLLINAADSLNSSKDAELVVTVTDVNSSKVIKQDTKPVKICSRYDMQWEDSAGTPYYENILAWVTPEAPEILTMVRDSGDSCNEISNGGLDAIVGYQKVGSWSQEETTAYQVLAMMYTLAGKYNVQYTNTSFSSTGSGLQRISTPANVIKNSAGLCIETAVTMASAIESTGMHAVIILLPGHAQVAVETGKNTGEYLLIETTALDSARAAISDSDQWDNVISYPTKDEWTKFLAEDGVVAIDCDLAAQLHIQPID